MCERKKEIVQKLLKWHRENRRNFPWRNEPDPYKVLVAEFFLQKTPADRVQMIYLDFIEEYPDPRILAESNAEQLKNKYRSLGLVKRFDWLIESMKIICEKYNRKIPNNKKELIELPGVGEYTASAILSFAFKKRVPIVDANVRRLYTRLFDIPNNEIENEVSTILPEENYVTYNEAILDYSALVCSNHPKCDLCFKKECNFIMRERKTLRY